MKSRQLLSALTVLLLAGGGCVSAPAEDTDNAMPVQDTGGEEMMIEDDGSMDEDVAEDGEVTNAMPIMEGSDVPEMIVEEKTTKKTESGNGPGSGLEEGAPVTGAEPDLFNPVQ